MNQAATIEIERNDEGCVLEIEHVFKAPIEDVYAAWSDPKRLAKWWGPQGMTCPVCDWDPAPGGTYRTCMQSPTGEQYCVGGKFTDVAPPSRLAFTWMWEGEGPTGGVDTHVTIDLEDLDGATRLKLTHIRLPDEESAKNHSDGWTSSFIDLADIL
jgi:uncharacterized protein YndB with AHSA1/START domain